MSFRLSSVKFWLPLASFWLSGLAGGYAQTAGQPGLAIRLPRMPGSEGITNSSQASSRRDGLQQLEDELSKSLKSLSPKSSLEGVLAPRYEAPRPSHVMPSKRVRAMLDRQKNWMAMTPEDLALGMEDDGSFKLPDSEAESLDKKAASSQDRIYEKSKRQLAGGKNPSLLNEDDLLGSRQKPGPRGAPGEPGSREETVQPGGVSSTERALRKILGLDTSSGPFAPPPRSTFADFFGLGDNTPSPDQAAAHKLRMQEYRQLLGQSSPVAGDLLNAPGAAEPARRPVSAGGLGASAGSARWNGFDASPGAINPALTPSAPPDPNAKVLNQWNPMYVTPKTEPPKFEPLAKPPTEFPRRKF